MMKTRTAVAVLMTVATAVAFASAPPVGAVRHARDRGNFLAAYGWPVDRDYRALRHDLQASRFLETIAGDLNDTFVLPSNITLSFGECGEINAYYDRRAREIRVCYELFERLTRLFEGDAPSREEANEAVVNTTMFVVYHELGHALIHVLRLPIDGREEDIVDQLATYVLADGTDEGDRAALDGARWFQLEAHEDQGTGFFDDHSINANRFENVVCWVYGQNEGKFAQLVSNRILPPHRAPDCRAEFQRIKSTWSRLLQPYVTNP